MCCMGASARTAPCLNRGIRKGPEDPGVQGCSRGWRPACAGARRPRTRWPGCRGGWRASRGSLRAWRPRRRPCCQRWPRASCPQQVSACRPAALHQALVSSTADWRDCRSAFVRGARLGHAWVSRLLQAPASTSRPPAVMMSPGSQRARARGKGGIWLGRKGDEWRFLKREEVANRLSSAAVKPVMHGPRLVEL